MPIYEYRCPDCAHAFEVIQKFSDDPVKVCPKCAQENVKKLISQTSFVLKGSGWYNDHYGLKSGSGEAASAKPAEKGAEGGADKAAAPAAAPAAPASSTGTSAASSSTSGSGGGSSSGSTSGSGGGSSSGGSSGAATSS